ncbi:unnamed protein product, partial [Adineta ricciae]
STATTTTPSCSGVSNPPGQILNMPSKSAASTYTHYTYGFTENGSSSTLSFIVNGDAGGGGHFYWLLDLVSVNDLNTSTNVLTNGDFETGDLTGWSQYCNNDANCKTTGYYDHTVTSSCYSGTYCVYDSCQNYDYLFQSFSIVYGHYHLLSYYLSFISRIEQKNPSQSFPKIVLKTQVVPPSWALMQRLLFDQLNKAALEFVERYTRTDGILIWRRDWPGMDGSDDPYEGFMNLSLLYMLGGCGELYDLSHKIWDGITWQWSEYGQIYRESDAYYDWMHHGEGYLYLYFLGLANPPTLKDRQRALNFANMYIGEDGEAQNYDKEFKLIRSPITGSQEPRFVLTAEDWSVEFGSGKCAWSNDEIYANIIQLMNERMTRGDVPLNLNATGLVAHAFLHSGRENYRQWVLEYLHAWEERTKRNNGIIPDNIGLTGQIGEYDGGKWWGGYYGWRWPHGFVTIIEPLINACMNAVLLTGDMSQLGLARQQLDANWNLRQEKQGQFLTMSLTDEDLERVDRIPKDHDWNEVIIPTVSGSDKRTGRATKHYVGNTQP